MWQTAPSYYYEPRVRFAEPRYGRQRYEDAYYGVAERPWRPYAEDDSDFDPPPPPPPPRPVQVRGYGRPRERRRRRSQPQQERRRRPSPPMTYREYVAAPPSRTRAARPPEPEEAYGQEETAFAEAAPLPAAASMAPVLDTEAQPPSERRFMAMASVDYSDAQQEAQQEAEEARGLFRRYEGAEEIQSDGKPGAYDDDSSDHDWSDGFVLSPLRPQMQTGDDLDVLDGFDFALPRAPSSSSSSKGGGELAELVDSAAVAGETGSSSRDDAALASNATRAFSSTYTGDAELGGVHGATLTVLHDPKGRSRPLYHWLHIQQDVMNFDEFWAEIPRQVRLSEAEMAATAKLRADVKRHAVKSRQNSKGAHVGYMDPRYFQVPLGGATAAKKKAQQQFAAPSWPPVEAAAVAAARWICLPYFALQRCAGLLSASSLASFPPLTLLQSHYSRTPQQRDLEQAVCELGAAPRGDCFHVAQLWCLVLDNTLLVTCGSMAQSDLYGHSLRLALQPSKAEASGRLLVSYGGAVTWTLNVKDCPTWFSFLARFGAFWPKSFEFTWHDRVVTPGSWPKILHVASQPQGVVTLSLRIVPQPEPPKTIRGPEEDPPRAAAGDAQDDAAAQAPEYLHVLTLGLADSPDPGAAPGGAVLEGLNKQLAAAEKFFLDNTSYAQQRAYKSCGGATRADVRAYLADRGDEVEARASDLLRLAYEERVGIFDAADVLFQLFLPRGFDGPTTSQYWASVKSLVLMRSSDGDDDARPSVDSEALRELRQHLRATAQDIRAFQGIVAHADDKDRAGIDLPRPLGKAWLHAVSAMLKVGAPRQARSSWMAHMTKARDLIEDGMQAILRGLSSRSLVRDLAVLPLDVMSLIAMDLLQDQVGKADDVAETYSQYLSSLDTDITTKPSDRSYQHRIELVQQEMSAVRRTLAKQRNLIGGIRGNLWAAAGSDVAVAAALDDGTGRRRRRRQSTPGLGDQPPAYGEDPAGYPPPYPHAPPPPTARYADAGPDRHAVAHLEAASKLPPTEGLGFRGLFLAECARIVDQREFDFRRHADFAQDLERAAAYKMGWTKDRQENAIYAFTIVTIIFLPISAISSIFGMNTNDVRNMASNQWLYWAVAVPITLLVILIGLWWMNELGSVLQWITGKRPRRLAGSGSPVRWVPHMPDAAVGKQLRRLTSPGNPVRWVSHMPGYTYVAPAPPSGPEAVSVATYAEEQGDAVPARWRRYSEDLPAMASTPQLRRRPRTTYTY